MMTPNQRGRMYRIVVAVCGALAVTGCQKPTPPATPKTPRHEAPPEHAAAAPKTEAEPEATSSGESSPAPEVTSADESSAAPDSSPAPEPRRAAAVKLPVVIPPNASWVAVVAFEADAPGGWVTGDFDAERNKIEIRTHGVSRFAMDLGRLPIDWSRKVILGINGRNSELVKRDYNVYQVGRDESGGWSVIE